MRLEGSGELKIGLLEVLSEMVDGALGVGEMLTDVVMFVCGCGGVIGWIGGEGILVVRGGGCGSDGWCRGWVGWCGWRGRVEG